MLYILVLETMPKIATVHIKSVNRLLVLQDDDVADSDGEMNGQADDFQSSEVAKLDLFGEWLIGHDTAARCGIYL